MLSKGFSLLIHCSIAMICAISVASTSMADSERDVGATERIVVVPWSTLLNSNQTVKTLNPIDSCADVTALYSTSTSVALLLNGCADDFTCSNGTGVNNISDCGNCGTGGAGGTGGCKACCDKLGQSVHEKKTCKSNYCS